MFVHECMSRRGRIFHSVEHALVVSNSPDPAQALGGIFHDIVYWQVDGGLVERVGTLIGAGLRIEGDDVFVKSDPREGDSDLAVAMAIFGIEPGQRLELLGGRNEFLSALVALKLVGRDLTLGAKARIAASIEATFPFRKADEGGSPLDRLYARLVRANEALSLGLSADDLVATTIGGQQISHRDLGSFGQDDPARFLDNTWQLIPETTFALRTRAYYTCSEYRAALERMERFLANLDPSLVFMRFRDNPDEQTWRTKTDAAANNIRVGTRYLRAKLAAAYTIEAFAEGSGGDAPVSLFMGDLPDGTPLLHLEDFLPEAPARSTDLDDLVERLLVDGRSRDTDFDIKHAPVAAFIYRSLGCAETERFLAKARETARPDERLRHLEPRVRDPIAAALIRLAPTRSSRIVELMEFLSSLTR